MTYFGFDLPPFLGPGGEGGFEVDQPQYETVYVYRVVLLPDNEVFDLMDPRLPENVGCRSRRRRTDGLCSRRQADLYDDFSQVQAAAAAIVAYTATNKAASVRGG